MRPGQEEKCYLCSNTLLKRKHFLLVSNFKLYRCPRCSLIFTDVDSSEKNLKKINDSVYSDDYYQNYFARKEELVERFSDRVQDIKKETNGREVLDVGCSYGFFLESLKRANKRGDNWRYHGVEVSARSAYYSNRKYGNVFPGFLEDARYPSKNFDIVTLWDVLEHVPDPRKMLLEIRRILKPNGLLVIQSPNSASFMAKTFKSAWPWWSPPDHLWHFNSTTIDRLLSESGFKVKKIKTWESDEDFVNMIYGPYLSSIRPQKIMEPLLKMLLWPVVKLLQILELGNFGGLLLVFAEK